MSAITEPIGGKLCTVSLIPKTDTFFCHNEAKPAEPSHNNDLGETGTILAYKHSKPAPPTRGVCLHVEWTIQKYLHHLGPYGRIQFTHSDIAIILKLVHVCFSKKAFTPQAVVKLSSGMSYVGRQRNTRSTGSFCVLCKCFRGQKLEQFVNSKLNLKDLGHFINN